jgi:hypothetical protein
MKDIVKKGDKIMYNYTYSSDFPSYIQPIKTAHTGVKGMEEAQRRDKHKPRDEHKRQFQQGEGKSKFQCENPQTTYG